MPDCAHFQQLVEAAIQQSLNDVRSELAARVMQAIAPELASDPMERLATAVRGIESAHAQTDILAALLNGCAGFATRCALFVARGVSAPLWQSSGFDSAVVRGISAQVANGLGAMAMQSLAPACGNALEFDERFIGAAGAPASGKCVVLPLVVREKVAALVYADAGSDGECDLHALEILVRAAGNRIEIASTRKAPVQAAAAAAGVPPAAVPHTAVAATPTSSAPAPAVHAVAPAPAHATAATMPAMAPQFVAPAAVAVAPEPTPTAQPATPVPATPADEFHAKARRFAKLLVEEIKLYNQQQVTAGREAGDLYDRLREPIDKSREAYEKRYANSPAAEGNYFVQELVRILADNKIALLGPNFPR